jgi:hypothetical protein
LLKAKVGGCHFFYQRRVKIELSLNRLMVGNYRFSLFFLEYPGSNRGGELFRERIMNNQTNISFRRGPRRGTRKFNKKRKKAIIGNIISIPGTSERLIRTDNRR